MEQGENSMKARPLGIVIWVMCFIMLSSAAAQDKPDQPRNVELTNAAWDAYKKGDFAAAIAAAERCIRRFQDQADHDQAELQNRHTPAPPIGKVSAEQKKAMEAGKPPAELQKAIFDNGVLNDVA